MTGFHTYATGQKVGRTKRWEERLTLPLTSEMVDRLDAAKQPGEDRLTVIRAGIERELEARGFAKPETEAQTPRKPSSARERTNPTPD